MGCAVGFGEKQQVLTVATLNYSGILLSPYQFYESGDEDQKRLNQTMAKVFEEEKIRELSLPDEKRFKFQFGPFEKQWQKQRYSPLYLPTCGIKNNVYMMGRQEFIKEWNQRKDQNIYELNQQYRKWAEKKKGKTQGQKKKKKQNEPEAQQKKQQKIQDKEYYLQNLMKLDLYIYKALLKHIYSGERKQNGEFQPNKQINDHFDEGNQFQLLAKQYRANRKRKFMKSFLDEDKKIQITINAMIERNIDIFFLQQASPEFLQTVEKKLNNYRIVKSGNCQSVIIIRESKFPHMRSLIQENSRLTSNINRLTNPSAKQVILTPQQLQSLNFNKDTVIQCIYNIIFICPHLVSKKQTNPLQIEDMKERLAFLKAKFPDCHIILGGDLNGQVQNFERKYDDKSYKFNVVPDYKLHYTAYKKRTQLQAQNNKADAVILESKDYIISDLEIIEAKIMTVYGTVIVTINPENNQQKYKTIEMEQKQENIRHEEEKLEKQRQKNLGKAELKELNQKKQMLRLKNINKQFQVLLPCDRHPYDHYLLIAKIKIPASLEHVTDPYYLYKYKPTEIKVEHLKQLETIIANQQEKQKERRHTEAS